MTQKKCFMKVVVCEMLGPKLKRRVQCLRATLGEHPEDSHLLFVRSRRNICCAFQNFSIPTGTRAVLSCTIGYSVLTRISYLVAFAFETASALSGVFAGFCLFFAHAVDAHLKLGKLEFFVRSHRPGTGLGNLSDIMFSLPS